MLGGGDDRGLADVMRGLSPAIHSIMGVGKCVGGAEALLPVRPTTRIEYFLMTLRRGALRPVLPPEPGGVAIRRADASDAEALFPLQKGYELEEVVIDPFHFSDGQCMKLLKQSLRAELVYVAECDGRPWQRLPRTRAASAWTRSATSTRYRKKKQRAEGPGCRGAPPGGVR